MITGLPSPSYVLLFKNRSPSILFHSKAGMGVLSIGRVCGCTSESKLLVSRPLRMQTLRTRLPARASLHVAVRLKFLVHHCARPLCVFGAQFANASHLFGPTPRICHPNPRKQEF